MSEIENNPVDPASDENPESTNPGLEHLDETTRAEILKLRKESADKRVKNKELATQLEEIRVEQQKAKEAKLKEDGKLQELLTEKEQELESLLPLKEKVANYEKHLSEQLEAATAKLDDVQAEMIKESGWSIDKKLEYAIKLAGQVKPVNSPDSKRPGGDMPANDINLDEYSGPQGRVKLVALKQTNPKLYEQVMGMKTL